MSAPLHVHAWGDEAAPAVVCLHGIGGHGGRFRRLAERLSSTRRVVAPDLRGHGRSPWEPPWTFEQHIADLGETLDALAIGRAPWVGHSFGGRIALELAAREPERVGGLVLLDPALIVPPPIALDYAEEARHDPSYADLDDALAQAREQNGASTEEALALLEEDLREHLQPGEDGRLRFRRAASAVVAAFSELARPMPDFAAWPTGTRIVRGAESHVVPDVLVDLVRDGAGDAVEIVTVPGGHSVLWDAFAETAAAVEEALAAA